MCSICLTYTSTEGLAIREHILGPDHFLTATSLDQLASLLRSMGNYSRAYSLVERALRIRQQVLGFDHPVTVQSLHHRALLIEAMSRVADTDLCHGGHQ